ncbi:hypothetical protein [Marinococcus sp. PL1-022]|uniref:hypothetical protein n=1 Tax=Marinococcus sp. PL1-022 TaxID=3095363 RepID=UPI0029C30F59|nr:hypothetical protein [Marinococcus sp. PL1-022]MDX6153667.1 hypothetical protein [Marinococcus sp. PL1-022]
MIQTDGEIKKFSIAAIGILSAQWALFLTGFYTILPYAAVEKIFISAWVVSAGVGFIGAAWEWGSNQRFSRLLLMLAVLNGLFAWAAHGLGSM